MNPALRYWHTPWLIRASLLVHGLALLVFVLAPQQWQWPLAIVIANHLLLAGVGLWPRSTWLGNNWVQLPPAAIARREIALTIDDGPDPEITPQVLGLLAQHQVRATFFCIGERAACYPELCREIVQRGHAVENHSQHHQHNFSVLGSSAYAREIQAAQDALTTITGVKPIFFRAPAGLRNPFLDPVLQRLQLTLASWSVRAYDTRVGDAARVATQLIKGLQPGAILLLHDGHAARTAQQVPVIIEVLPQLIAAAAKADLQFVTLREACK